MPVWKLDSIASRTDVVVGRTVAVWADGPVLDSHPLPAIGTPGISMRYTK
jgi:hypothetical protein